MTGFVLNGRAVAPDMKLAPEKAIGVTIQNYTAAGTTRIFRPAEKQQLKVEFHFRNFRPRSRVLELIGAEREDDSSAQPQIVLPVPVAVAVEKLRMPVVRLNEANRDPGIQSPIRSAARREKKAIVCP